MKKAVPAGRRGFTLIELIISLSLMVMLTGSMFFALGQGMRGWRKAGCKISKLQIKNMLAERITGDLRFASQVLTGSGSQEMLLKVGPDQIGYKLVEGKVRREKGATSAYLTCEDEVKKLSFSYPSADQVQIVVDELTWKICLRN